MLGSTLIQSHTNERGFASTENNSLSFATCASLFLSEKMSWGFFLVLEEFINLSWSGDHLLLRHEWSLGYVVRRGDDAAVFPRSSEISVFPLCRCRIVQQSKLLEKVSKYIGRSTLLRRASLKIEIRYKRSWLLQSRSPTDLLLIATLLTVW